VSASVGIQDNDVAISITWDAVGKGTVQAVDLARSRNDRLMTETFMPFKSQAQRRKFAELLVEGKISNETFEEWNRETGGRKLPERVKTKTRKAGRRKTSVRRRLAARKK
jgi:hypothetical protein